MASAATRRETAQQAIQQRLAKSLRRWININPLLNNHQSMIAN
jgi:hypothetical protein